MLAILLLLTEIMMKAAAKAFTVGGPKGQSGPRKPLKVKVSPVLSRNWNVFVLAGT